MAVDDGLYILYYFNWLGTNEELKLYIQREKEIAKGIDGLEFKGVFTPITGWNYVILFEAKSYERALSAWRNYVAKYGANPNVVLTKDEILRSLLDEM